MNRSNSSTLYSEISIYVSYANDATMKRNLSRHQKWISIHASYANNATPCVSSVAARTSFQSTHRTQTMRRKLASGFRRGHNFNPRIVRKRCDEVPVIPVPLYQFISIHASYANDATVFTWLLCSLWTHFNPRIVRKRCDYSNNSSDHTDRSFQSTHRTQTMRQFIEASAIESRSISIHASYANDATLFRIMMTL